jgi:hypothetical protein
MSTGGGFSWAKFLLDQGKTSAQLEQVRQDIKDLKATLADVKKAQEETKVLVGAVRGGYKTILVTATLVGAIATLAARWWVASHAGG